MPHFDPTVTLGNLITVASAIVLIIIGWRDLNWRVKNLEEWRSGHEHMATVALENLSLLRSAVQEMRAIAQGQERRLVMLEERDPPHRMQ